MPVDSKSARWHGLSRFLVTAIVVAAGVVGMALPAAGAVAPPSATPSDPRAQLVQGNVTTCAQLGLDGSSRMGAERWFDASDAYVTTTSRDQRYIDVSITPAGVLAGVVIDAVVVKGGDGYNLYTDPSVLPPALGVPQGYHSPSVGSGNIPQISHWFVCYHIDALPTGSLLVNKDFIPPTGVPVEELPLQYVVLVECDAPGFESVLLTFGRGGGVPLPADDTVIVGIPVGTLCTITELDTDGFPAGTVVTYAPARTVQIAAEGGNTVAVRNDFSAVAVREGQLVIQKAITEGTPPGDWTIDYACTDDTAGTITIPAGGGTSAPIVVDEGAFCVVAEPTAALPSGWTVAYQLGDAVQSDPPVAFIGEEPVTVGVLNTGPATPAPSPTVTPAPTTAPDPEQTGELAASGGSASAAPALMALAVIIAGFSLTARGRRPRRG